MADIKNKRQRLLSITIVCSIIFLICFGYFYLDLTRYTYLGIRAQQFDNTWTVKKILAGGAADKSELKVGDIISTIDGKKAEENKTLNNFLIVEKAQDITILRNGEEQKIHFEKDQTAFYLFLIFSSICFIGLAFLFRYVLRQNNSRSSIYFYQFSLLILFSALSVIPSSIGNILGRLGIVLFISFVPIYFNFFFMNMKSSKKYKWNKLYYVLIGIMIANTILCLSTVVVLLPNVLAEYLAQGIFYTLGISLLFVLMRSVFHKQNELYESKINLPLINFLSFAPLFFCNVLPGSWEAPFFWLIPFLLLPLFVSLHLLTLSKFIFNRYRLSDRILYIILAFFLSCAFLLLSELKEYIPIQVVFFYGFLLLYALFPFIEELLFLSKKRLKYPNSLALFSAVEDERENISLFIHDTVIQEVTYSMKEINKHQTEVSKKEVIYILEEVIFYLRELCSNIYPLMIQEIGLSNTLMSMTNQFEKKHPVFIKHSIEEIDLNLSVQKRNFIFRSLRELINNSILHGHATEILLTVRKVEDMGYFSVEDNGKFSISTKQDKLHFGLEVIKEKVMLLNGELHINTDEGTKIEITIPLEDRGERNGN